MSLWQLATCVEGWNRTHGGEPGTDPPTDDEFEAAKRAHGDD